jgi:hypothetical protein
MPGAKYIKDALGLAWERCQAIGLAESVHALSPTGQDFMGVSLVTDIPDELVDGGVVRIVECNRELNDAKACTEVSAGLTNRIQQEMTKLPGKVIQLFWCQLSKVRWVFDGIE